MPYSFVARVDVEVSFTEFFSFRLPFDLRKIYNFLFMTNGGKIEKNRRGEEGREKREREGDKTSAN